MMIPITSAAISSARKNLSLVSLLLMVTPRRARWPELYGFLVDWLVEVDSRREQCLQRLEGGFQHPSRKDPAITLALCFRLAQAGGLGTLQFLPCLAIGDAFGEGQVKGRQREAIGRFG